MLDHIIIIRFLTCFVTIRLFIRTSGPLQTSSAYLFIIGSTPMLSDSGNSWPDYIPWHHSHGFTSYALRLTRLLHPAFALGLRLLTAFPLHFPLMTHDLPDSFTVGGITVANAFIKQQPLDYQLFHENQNQLRILPSCYHTAFYPCFWSITDQSGVPFCHQLCTSALRQRRLLAGLYSIASQPWFHRLRSAADWNFTSSLRTRIAA